jgi:hypothetical protein
MRLPCETSYLQTTYTNYELNPPGKGWMIVPALRIWPNESRITFPEIVEGLLDQFVRLWWECPTTVQDLGRSYELHRQLENEKRTDQALAVLDNSLIQQGRNGLNKEDLLRKLTDTFFNYTQEIFGFEPQIMQALRAYGFEDALRQFARMARQFDPSISITDIYQAGRNLWSMNFVQLLLGRPVEVTPSAFAYSMLYPYTDNYLDDPQVSGDAKRLFNRRFALRLAGETVKPLNKREERIFTLVEMVEAQHDRRLLPQVYESLLAIHKAQSRSLSLLQGDASPYAVDILGICFEKGGTSVLADGYLVAGDLTRSQQEKMFAYGALTQLIDDLEDAQNDRNAGLMTVFSQTLGRWHLDGVANRTLNFGEQVVEILAADAPPLLDPLMNLFRDAIPLVLIQAASGQRRYFSREYASKMQAHFPLRFRALEARQKRIFRKRQELSGLVNALIF